MPLGDQLPVPAAAVLLVQRDQLPVGDADRAAGVGEQHQREQAGDLGDVGEQGAQDPGQPDRLVGELVADRRGIGRGGEVALVEDQVDDGQHAVHALAEIGRGGHRVGDLRDADLLLRAGDALRHRGLGDEERLRDLGHGQPAEQAQGERHPCLRGERRVATGEDQPEPVVLDDAGRFVGAVVSNHECRLVLGVAMGLAPNPVDRAVAGGRGEPAAGVRRYAVPGPALDRGQERLPGRLLGDVDVAEAADQGGDDPAVLLAIDPLDRGGGIGRDHPAVRPPARAGKDGPRPCPRRPSRPRSPTAGRRRGPAARGSRSRRSTPWTRRTGRR